jgi:hypothetical protein
MIVKESLSEQVKVKLRPEHKGTSFLKMCKELSGQWVRVAALKQEQVS